MITTDTGIPGTIPAPETDVSAVVADLNRVLPAGAVSIDPDALDEVAHDRSHHHYARPAVVVRCTSTEQVSATLAVCHRHRIPVVPRGSGTGLEGASNARDGVVVLDLRGMDAIVAVHPQDFDAVVQPGLMKSVLNARLREDGLFFPAGPGVDASMGGMLSTRASGTNAVRYGTMRENVMALTVVLADGRVIRTGSRTRKSAAGYDLTHLFVGAEGTLGVITEAVVRVHGIPRHSAAMICGFTALSDATDVVYEALRREIPISRVELLDTPSMVAINRFTGSGFAEVPTLIFEVQGSEAAVTEELRVLAALAGERGAIDLQSSHDPVTIDAIWSARHDALPASAALVDGAHTWSTDVCVPISRLAECIALTQADVEAAGLLAPIVGHVGDGNFHLAFVLVPGDEDSLAKAHEVNDRLITRALAMDGTSTGEHGIGFGKKPALRQEHGDSLEVMAAIKLALDPHRLLNPGVMLDDEAFRAAQA
ncbi:FAD-linked oxidase C-terminal domain-containing protein [Mycetocola sp. 2940]|uniref:FAD-binding oxidoreductase n=1 Tax=Mycetocola sp. 2940 TaxID=3156452 RepID=UPI00339B246D